MLLTLLQSSSSGIYVLPADTGTFTLAGQHALRLKRILRIRRNKPCF
jgi:hypothetical protein